MATHVGSETADSSRPAASGKVIRRLYPLEQGNGGSWKTLVPACVISGALHVILLGLFYSAPALGIHFLSAGETTPTEMSVLEGTVEENAPKQNLENDEIGDNPEVAQNNYNVDRVEPLSIPGIEKNDQPIGIPGGPDDTPMNVPPPPGFNQGTGAGLEGNAPGKAAPFGLPGGFNGPLMAPGSFGGRSASTRQKLVESGGGNQESEAAVAAALRWLHLHQAADGHWSLDGFDHHARRQTANGDTVYERCNCQGAGHNNDIAGTAFGLLPFLGGGQTHRGGGEGQSGIYTKDVEKGLKYLILKQNASGDFGGGMYSHGLATIVMCEAYGLTSDPLLKGPAQRGLNFIAKAQSNAGGWSYTSPCTGHDTSVGGWQLMALKSGQMAGLEVYPGKTFLGATRWLDAVSSRDGSGYGYQTAENPTPTMTAVGLLCRQYLGIGPRNPGLIKGVAELKKTPPRTMQNMYYYYYATQVMHHMGGEAWAYWNPKMRDWLITTQDKGRDPKHIHQKGSWDPKGDTWGPYGGRIMVTSMAVLTLEVYYRHLPLYRRELGGGK